METEHIAATSITVTVAWYEDGGRKTREVAYVRSDLSAARVADKHKRLNLAIAHMNGKECPECFSDSVVEGCSGECCVLCDYEQEPRL